VPTSSEPNVFPAELVARAFSAPGIHTMAVTAFDGLEDSATPIVYELGSSLPVRDLPIRQPDGRQFEIDLSSLGGVPVKLYYQLEDWGRTYWKGPISIPKHVLRQTVPFTNDELMPLLVGIHLLRCRYETPTGHYLTKPFSWRRWNNVDRPPTPYRL
jgi:hypothetical protein